MNETIVKSVTRKFNGDSVSPILLFRRLRGDRKFFLESSRQFEGSGKYSYMGVNPIKTFVTRDNQLVEINRVTGETHEYYGNPFDLLQQLVPNKVAPSEYDFNGGLVGFVTHDSMVNLKSDNVCDINLPTVHFDLYETVIVYSQMTDEVIIIHNEIIRSFEEANVDALIDQIFQGEKESTKPFELEKFECQSSEEQFSQMVQQAKGQILQGSVVQLFLTKRYEAKFSGDAFSMYRKLRKELPAPSMFYYEVPDFVVMGVSPESIIKIRGKQVYVTPVTGARPRGSTPREDTKMELSILQNAREVAAHNILVDSTMADLEKICIHGTIHLLDYMKPMQFKHSIRLKTEIEGILNDQLKPIEALAVLTPPASSSGVPKRTAAAIIRSIEPQPRSFSGGIFGVVGLNGNIDFTILQQAMVIKNDQAYIQAGANILGDTMETDATLEIRKKLKAFLNIE